MHLLFIKGSCHIQIKSLEHSAFTTVIHQKHQGCVMAILGEQGVVCYRNHYCLPSPALLLTSKSLSAFSCSSLPHSYLASLPPMPPFLTPSGSQFISLTSWPSPPCSPLTLCQKISPLSLPFLLPSPPCSLLYWSPFSPLTSSPLSCSLLSRVWL